MKNKTPTNNTLNPAFYKMMDFFLDKEKKHIRRLSNQGILGYEYPEDNTPYNQWTLDEYFKWNDSLKFQYDAHTLHKYLPKNIGFQQFFKDIHLRIPHENTLLIQVNEDHDYLGGKKVNMVSVKEMSIQKFNEDVEIFPMKSSEVGVSMKEVIDRWVAVGVKDLYLCVSSVYTWMTKDAWTNLHEYDPLDIQAITAPNCFSCPFFVILPAGLSLEQSRSFPPMTLKTFNMDPTPDNSCYVDAICSPVRSHGIKNKPFVLQGMEELKKDTLLKKILREKNPKLNTTQQVWERVFSAVSHMSIYSHPDFKEFCVHELKQQGLEPKKVTYHSGNPFKKMSSKPKFEHYLLDLNDHTTGKAGKKRFHLVRGHLMRTQDGGFAWRRSHWRGNRKLGVITKDYNIKIDPRIKRNKPDRHETTTVSAERT
jgi:hypothetical protein